MKKSILLNSSSITKEFNKIMTAVGVNITRLGFLPANFSPLGSFGFFGGSSVLFFGSIFLFDYLRGGFYPGFYMTYIGFAAYYVLGRLAQNSVKKQVTLLPIASLLFFLLSNAGVWWYWYPRTVEGLFTCYTLALPFLRNTLLSDVSFGYGFIFLRKFISSMRFNDKLGIITS